MDINNKINMQANVVVLNCRACTRACKQYKSLMDVHDIAPNEKTLLADMLAYISNLSFDTSEAPMLSQHICITCIGALEQAFNFKRMLLESDELLRSAFHDVREEYVVFEMLKEEDKGAGDNLITNEITTLATTVSEPSESDYLIEQEFGENSVMVSEIGDDINEGQSSEIEFETAKGEYDGLIDNDDIIEVADSIGDSNNNDNVEQILEEVVVMNGIESQHDIIEQIDETIDVEQETSQDDEEEGEEEELDQDQEQEEEHLQGEGEGDDSELMDQDYEYMEEFIISNGDVLPHICNVCGKAFRQQCRLKQHMRSHTDEKHYSCEVCDKKLKHIRNYKEHMLSHSNIKPHQCPICQRFYRTASSLAAHKRTHAKDKPYKCVQCGRGYAAYDHLRRHMLTHTGERPYACDLCDKAYYDSSSLRQHKISHTGEKAFKCEICGVGLSQKSGYKKHMLVHSGEKPHTCPICGRAFTFTSNLNAHLRLHSGEKPFQCEVCQKSFPTKKRLNSHLRVHNRDKPVVPTSLVSAKSANQSQDIVASFSQQHSTTSTRSHDQSDQQVCRSNVVMVV